MWAVGVITFALITGNAPFVGKTKQAIYDAVCNKEPKYEKLANKCSKDCENFIKACLQKNS